METVLITGVGRGIGYKLAEDFLRLGYNVIGTVRDDASRQRVSDRAAGLGAEIELHILEITDSHSVDKFTSALTGRCIDILINSAGIIGGDHQTHEDLNFDDWERTFQVNTVAPMRIALALLPNLSLSKNAKIVSISSKMGALSGKSAGAIAYRSSKAALNKSMQCLAIELKPKNIGVYLVHPGWVRTDMGGESADISVEESSAGLIKVITAFSMQHTGRFWQYDGQELDW
ncbi:SDR family oxidoreductase [Gynuella sunshinyii]|uniref:Short-chain dehydrogenase of various substrate specificities n=1 Tax=Gynuella sunshinyii YC6258 TaxID=1445510 RepID=A0A0C5VJQ2_9GAMM|nr:SDR family oxidoreductase [Gynuella sunshinyii]AJQ93618.1 short-chain dehydrogenase of various substrate specificities [Gynuella sunshinyii YC6258]